MPDRERVIPSESAPPESPPSGSTRPPAVTPGPASEGARAPFHAGERDVQSRVGVRERMEEVGGRFLRDFMPDQHRDFFAALPWVAVAGVDRDGHPRASVLAGPPGFASSPDPRTLRLDALPAPGDPLAACLSPGARVGLLGIELATRRRNRMNGTVVAVDERGLSVRVDQSFGNCKQYIQARELAGAAVPDPDHTREEGPALSPRTRAWIAAADTFFIASASPDARARTGAAGAEGVDISHRGGKPGFIEVRRAAGGGAVLTWPDFSGNFLFNTLGNLAREPRAALLFLDFDRGDLLEVCGRAEVIWDGPAVWAFAGAERLVTFAVDGGRIAAGGFPLRGSEPAMARELAETGSWEEVDRILGQTG